MTAGPLDDRVLALLAGGWVTAQRLARAVQELLSAGGLLAPSAEAEEVTAALEHGARAAGRLGTAADVIALRRRLRQVDGRLCVAGSADYPAQLLQTWPQLGAPLWLTVRAPGGRLPAGPAVAVVGTRHATLDGLRTAEELGRLLGRNGVTVVSGFARGIDQAAHRGALATGGRTVAVLGAGFATDYPRGDGALREEVAASGGLVTELLPDDPPRPRHFLARNRIVSGLADAVVIVEGRARSGALATARLGASQGRDVWAVPGSLHAPTSQAPLALIRDGAQVLTALDDVFASLATAWGDVGATGGVRAGAGPPAPGPVPGTPGGLSVDAATVLGLLGAEPCSPSRLASGSALPLPAVLVAVSELSARGLVANTARGLVRT
jgi:DNA processing protein